MHRLIQIDDTIGMYDKKNFAKELRFYNNHKSEVKENMWPPILQTIPRAN
jgi:hypothetical protein